ncbi:hypothetical protein LSCM1_05888 [Leishmania martiniquensis]|uniref:Anoctamin transmembrane domain-containing protein n=1 Tax=Leishmania martiniquensis TaxID=1580590 RepID=A0A836HH57_9TRYP|nr:hypothetical protein LSCM1_05888 [Leishmania martiniquensis]
MTAVPAKSLASKPTAAAPAAAATAAAPSRTLLRRNLVSSSPSAAPTSAPAVISPYAASLVSSARGVGRRSRVGATAHLDPPKKRRRGLGKSLLGMPAPLLPWTAASDKELRTSRPQRQRAPPATQALPLDSPRSITARMSAKYATHRRSVCVTEPCTPPDVRGGRTPPPHGNAPLPHDADGKPPETPRGVTKEQLAAVAADAQQQLAQPNYVSLKARQAAAEQRWEKSHNYDLVVHDLHERLGILASTQRGAREETNALPTPMTVMADVTGELIALRRAEMAETVARLRRMFSEANIAGIPIIPALSLEAVGVSCPSCQYCIELTSEATIKEHLIAVLQAIASKRVLVSMSARCDSKSAVNSVPSKSLTAPESYRAQKGRADKPPPAAAAPLFSLLRCFRVEVVPFALHKVSIHVSVYKSVAEDFFTAHARQQERLLSLAIDPPFPKEWAEWTDAHRQRLLHGVLGELLHGGASPVVPATLGTIVLFPAHVESMRDALWRSVWPARSLTEWLTIPEDAVASYLGEEIMFYFAWMNHYARWLLGAGLLGVLVSMLSSLRLVPDAAVAVVLDTAGCSAAGAPMRGSATASSMALRCAVQYGLDVALMPLFSASMIIGSVMCIKMWERRCRALCMKHHLFQQEGKDELRHDFRGTPGTNPVTGVPQLRYPAWYRAVALQPLAWGVVALFMGGTLALMVCSLNLDGMVSDPESPLVIPFLRRLAVDGGALDKSVHPIAAMLPALGYSVCIAALSSIFTGLAMHLTRMENYRYRAEHMRALTLKRVAFEFVNSYAKLFFIAFGRGSVSELSSHLQPIFFAAVLRRIMSDTVLPFVVTHRRRVVRRLFRVSAGDGASASLSLAPLSDPAAPSRSTHGGSSDSPLDEVDEMLDPYDIYMDFIDTLVQFGYILLFAAAYPLASFVALLSNIIVVRSHLFKMCYIVRRPVPRLGVQQNAMWCGIMRGFVIAAVITNTLLLDFTAPHAVRWFPAYVTLTGTPSRQRTSHQASLRSCGYVSEGIAANLSRSVNLAGGRTGGAMPSQGRMTVLHSVVIEHIMCLIAAFLLWRIPSTPREVRHYQQRKLHERMSPQ